MLAYGVLMRCVYAKLTVKALRSPLYLQFAGSASQMRATLFCIYCGLPWSLRKRLSVASSTGNNAERTHLIFSEKAVDRPFYVDPRTGSNNVLDKRMARRIERLGFVDYYVAHFDDIDGSAYFELLNREAVALGDAQALDATVLRLAHANVVAPDLEGLSDSELLERLSIALGARTHGGASYDSCILALLAECMRRGITLDEGDEALLRERLAQASGDELREAVIEYDFVRFKACSPEETARTLSELDDKTRLLYLGRLSAGGNDQEAIDCYYAETVLQNKQPTWQFLEQMLYESGTLSSRDRTLREIDSKATELYNAALRDLPHIVFEYNSYVHLMKDMLAPEMADRRARAAREAYWNVLGFDGFLAADEQVLATMSVECPRAGMFKAFEELMASASHTSSPQQFLVHVWSYFSENTALFKSVADHDEAVRCLVQATCGHYISRDTLFERWIAFAAAAPQREIFELGMDARNQLYANNFGGCASGCLRLYAQLGGEPADVARAYRLHVANALVECAELKERYDSMLVVPLDVWLACGAGLYDEDPFRVFDVHKARILHESPFKVVEATGLFATSTYLNAANRYVQEGGSESRAVNAWLSALSSQGIQQKVMTRLSSAIEGGKRFINRMSESD